MRISRIEDQNKRILLQYTNERRCRKTNRNNHGQSLLSQYPLDPTPADTARSAALGSPFRLSIVLSAPLD